MPTAHTRCTAIFFFQGLSGFGREGTTADLDVMTQWKWITIRMS